MNRESEGIWLYIFDVQLNSFVNGDVMDCGLWRSKFIK